MDSDRHRMVDWKTSTRKSKKATAVLASDLSREKEKRLNHTDTGSHLRRGFVYHCSSHASPFLTTCSSSNPERYRVSGETDTKLELQVLNQYLVMASKNMLLNSLSDLL